MFFSRPTDSLPCKDLILRCMSDSTFATKYPDLGRLYLDAVKEEPGAQYKLGTMYFDAKKCLLELIEKNQNITSFKQLKEKNLVEKFIQPLEIERRRWLSLARAQGHAEAKSELESVFLDALHKDKNVEKFLDEEIKILVKPHPTPEVLTCTEEMKYLETAAAEITAAPRRSWWCTIM